MVERTSQAPERGKRQDRETRLADALRRNLRKRKQQARARGQRRDEERREEERRDED